jgi:hypothetical protein
MTGQPLLALTDEGRANHIRMLRVHLPRGDGKCEVCRPLVDSPCWCVRDSRAILEASGVDLTQWLNGTDDRYDEWNNPVPVSRERG